MPKTFLNFPNDLLAKSYFVVLFSFNMLTSNFGVSILLDVKCWLLLRYLFLEDLDSVSEVLWLNKACYVVFSSNLPQK